MALTRHDMSVGYASTLSVLLMGVNTSTSFLAVAGCVHQWVSRIVRLGFLERPKSVVRVIRERDC